MTVTPFWRNLDNLGDKPLNSWLLPKLFPTLNLEDRSAEYVLSGIGSLFHNAYAARDLTPAKQNIPRLLFSTGTYGQDAMPAGSKVFCVRGRYTCEMLDIDSKYAIADGAILLPLSLPMSPTGDVDLAVVHKCEYSKAETAIEFSTRVGNDFTGFVKRLLCFRGIETHSLHAAIIADVYGVPWKPLQWASKWSDHFSQVGINERPKNFVLSSRRLLDERQKQLLEKVDEVNQFITRETP